MKITVKGAQVNLSKGNFVASGGEGEVYAKGSTGYKIYHDPKAAVPEGKVQELRGVIDPHIVTPRDLVYAKGAHVGHSFTFVPDCRTMCELFPRAFRDREGLTPDKVGHLITQARQSVESVHKASCLVVDLNEMNLLVSRDFRDVWFIDTDSYKTPSYPATAIMPSVRDWRTPIADLNPGSDWFSFAIVAYQLFRGIHPFKGKHTTKGLEARMKAGISVFDPAVRIPKAAYPENVIPAAWLDWFRDLFVAHKRLPPPVDMQGTLPAVYAIPVLAQGKVTLVTLVDMKAAVVGVWQSQGQQVAADVDGDTRVGPSAHHRLIGKVVGVTRTQSGDPVLVTYSNGVLGGYNTVTKAQTGGVPADVVTESGGRIYAKSGSSVSEVVARSAGKATVLGSHVRVNVLRHATRLFSGCVIQNVLGTPVASLLEEGKAHQVTLDELKGYQVHSAKYERGVLVVVGSKGGQYTRQVLRFSTDRGTHDCRVTPDISYSGANLAVLDTGVAVLMTEEGTLELFSSKMGSSRVQVVDDPALDPGMVLSSAGNALLACLGTRVLRLKLG